MKAADAEREADEAAAADATQNEQLAAVRAAQAVFEAELTLLRQTLRTRLESSHPAYPTLRAEKASSNDVDDDPDGPQHSPPAHGVVRVSSG